MPINLNALIRYKTIDDCLTNPNLDCTIDVLIAKCHNKLVDSQGIEKGVSERTIRNDIRILRSDILGFGAPIVVENGIYTYSNPDYTIFGRPILEMDLLKDIQDLLVENFESIDSPKLRIALMGLEKITSQKIPKKCTSKDFGMHNKKLEMDESDIFRKNLDSFIYKSKQPSKPRKYFFFKVKEVPQELLIWKFIFDVINHLPRS
jgi:hypothetical protein